MDMTSFIIKIDYDRRRGLVQPVTAKPDCGARRGRWRRPEHVSCRRAIILAAGKRMPA